MCSHEKFRLVESRLKWEKNRELEKTEKAKRWLHACGRKDFCELNQIKKDTYICTLHFVGGKGPNDDRPDPILATLSEAEGEKRAAYARKEQGHPPELDVKITGLTTLSRNQD